MRSVLFPLSLGLLSAALAIAACSGSSGSGFTMNTDSGGGGMDSGTGTDTGFFNGDSGPPLQGDGSRDTGGDGETCDAAQCVTVTTTIYANTDTTLYSVVPDPDGGTVPTVTMIGAFTGLPAMSGAVTDVAVNANGDVYVNTESAVFKATLPSGGTGSVALTQVGAGIMVQPMQKFYALAFAPAGSLDPSNEVLIGGDNHGEVWSIDTTSGMTKDLGNFGPDPGTMGNIFALSGDMVFYTDASNNPTGLATIRSCGPGGSGCNYNSDFLAGIDMNALKMAYMSGTAGNLMNGIYGSTGSVAMGNYNEGNGTGYGDLFGLAAWQGQVFAFQRGASMPPPPPQIISIDTMSGVGTPVGQPFSFMNGWSGAGVSTKTTIIVPPPPPPPPK